MGSERPRLRKHQEEGADFLEHEDVAVLLHDRGLGKTASALTALDRRIRSGNVKRALYLAPLSTLENVRREAFRFCDGIIPQVVDGTRAARQEMLRNDRPNLDILNYDALRILSPELAARKYDAIIADELSRIKAGSTQVSRIACLLGKTVPIKWGLTGMPFTEGVEDAWAEFYFLDPRILGENFYSFRNRYCTMNQERIERWVLNPATGRREKKALMIWKVTGYRNLAEFGDRILPYIHRAAREDCLDLPPRIFQVLEIPMMEEQAKIYRRMEREMIAEIDGRSIEPAGILGKMQKLRQIAAGFLYDDDHEARTLPCRKYEELDDFMKESLYDRRKLVVFTSFRAEPAMVMGVLERRGIEGFVLPEDPKERQSVVDAWGHFPKSSVLVANARSGGTGLNLQAADIAVFLSNGWSMEDRAQAVDRVYRMGSEVFEKILVVDFVTKGTVEEDVLEALNEKKDLIDTFMKNLKARAGR